MKVPTPSENPTGFHTRYQVKKLIESENFKGQYVAKDPDKEAEYFVLRLDQNGRDQTHIRACRIAVQAYADAIEHHIPGLASDLRERYPLL
jgi:hypothetical protein